MDPSRDFLVDPADLSRCEWADGPAGQGGVLLAVRRFAFTSNNVTYALCGGSLRYWDYFPAPAGRGRIPVWGIAEVLRSDTELEPGERIYGFLPMSTRLLVQPDQIRAASFVDGAAHRASLPRTYNEYVRIDRDRTYDAATADLHLVLRPLFSLSFFLAEFLNDKAFFGAAQVVVASASSKTAIGLAFMLKGAREAGVRIVGLTGRRNADAVAALGMYDDVLPYDEIGALSDAVPSVFVDIAGDPRIVDAAHRRLGPALRYSSAVGFTHAGAQGGAPPADLPGPRPEMFFTPSHILARREAWGRDELRRRLGDAWGAFTADMAPRLRITTSAGPEAIERVYAEVLAGRVPPDQAHILSLEQADPAINELQPRRGAP